MNQRGDAIGWLARCGPPLTIVLLLGPVLAGLGGTLLPAFGYLPALGSSEFSTAAFGTLADQPAIWRSALLSLLTGLTSALISLLIVAAFVAGWSGTRVFSKITSLLSPLLSVPHASAAIGLSFLIAPSGLLMRLVSPELTGWTRPPDYLIVNDPFGFALVAGLVLKETPFLLLMTLAALAQAPTLWGSTPCRRRSATAVWPASSTSYGLASIVRSALPSLR